MTRSLSGQQAEESNREETGSWSFANGTNGLLKFIVASVELRRPGNPAMYYSLLSPSPSLDLDLSVASFRADTLLSAPSRPLIMTKPSFT